MASFCHLCWPFQEARNSWRILFSPYIHADRRSGKQDNPRSHHFSAIGFFTQSSKIRSENEKIPYTGEYLWLEATQGRRKGMPSPIVNLLTGFKAKLGTSSFCMQMPAKTSSEVKGND